MDVPKDPFNTKVKKSFTDRVPTPGLPPPSRTDIMMAIATQHELSQAQLPKTEEKK